MRQTDDSINHTDNSRSNIATTNDYFMKILRLYTFLGVFYVYLYTDVAWDDMSRRFELPYYLIHKSSRQRNRTQIFQTVGLQIDRSLRKTTLHRTWQLILLSR